MNSKIKTLLLLTIIITTIILHTEKTPIVHAYTQTEHNNLEYINWIYLKPISPKTEHLIKPPDIIELKNGEFTNIQYTIYTYQIIINNPNNYDLIDYQVKIPITYSDVGDSFIWVKKGSIRIYDQNGQELPYWVESWDFDTKDAVVWVKIPKIPAGGSITLTLESSAKYSDKSNGYAVFDFFDGFETWVGWTQYKGGVVSQSSGQARGGTYSAKKDNNGDPNGAYKSLGFTLNYPFVLEAWIDRTYFSGKNADRIGVIDDNVNGYGIGVDMYVLDVYIDKRSPDVGVANNNVALSQSVTNDWYFVRFIWNNGNMKAEVYYNGVLLGSTTYTDTAYSSFTRVYIFGGYTYYVDDLRIRKYADVEPTVKIVPYGSTTVQYTVYTHQVVVSNPNDYDLIDYQVKIPITYSDVGDSFTWAKKGSIRIYDQSGQELPYWVESWDSDTKDAVVWVKVPRIPAGGSITLTLESSFKYSDKSDGDAVFEFFDDFKAADYTVIRGSASQVSIVDGTWLRIDSTTGYSSLRDIIIESAKSTYLTTDFIVEGKVYLEQPNNWVGFLVETSGSGYVVGWYGWVGTTGSIERWSNWGQTLLQSQIPHYLAGQGSTQILRFDRVGSELRMWDTDLSSVIATVTDSTYNEFTRVAVRVFKGAIYRIDWVRVRKYADVEPTVKIVS